jgi:N-acetylglucosaminyl-diphospho-decaprenol L-rhamnosyltransferase
LPAAAVVIVGHDSADALPGTLGALLPQLGADDEVVVVDCASRDDTAAVARAALGGRGSVLEPGENLGFAGGCNAGAAATSAPLLVLLNPDAVPEPGFLDALRAAADAHPRWGAWQALVSLPGRREVNTDGNVAHWLGIGWAGRLHEPAALARARGEHDVGFPSGAAMTVRREAWDAVGGFDARYFMYGEDLDLGLRLRLAGWGSGVAPAAEVVHDYAFTKGDYKWFWLERNRAWTVLGAYPGALLAALAPALLAFEVVLLLLAWRGGWLRAKLRAQAAVVRELPAIRARRAAVQATRSVSASEFAAALTDSLDSPNLAAAQAIPGAEALQSAYWRLVRAVVRE